MQDVCEFVSSFGSDLYEVSSKAKDKAASVFVQVEESVLSCCPKTAHFCW
jgi:hypothetical protein